MSIAKIEQAKPWFNRYNVTIAVSDHSALQNLLLLKSIELNFMCIVYLFNYFFFLKWHLRERMIKLPMKTNHLSERRAASGKHEAEAEEPGSKRLNSSARRCRNSDRSDIETTDRIQVWSGHFCTLPVAKQQTNGRLFGQCLETMVTPWEENNKGARVVVMVCVFVCVGGCHLRRQLFQQRTGTILKCYTAVKKEAVNEGFN